MSTVTYTRQEAQKKIAERTASSPLPLPGVSYVAGKWKPIEEAPPELQPELRAKTEAAAFYASIGQPELAFKYGKPEIPSGYEVESVKDVTSHAAPLTVKDVFAPSTYLEVTFKPKPKPLGFGEMGYIAAVVSENIILAVTKQKESPIGKAFIRGQFSPLYFATGTVGTLEADILGVASLGTSVYESARTGKLQYKPVFDVQLSPTVIGATIGALTGSPGQAQELEARPLAYKLGSAFGEAAYLIGTSVVTEKIVSKTVTPKVEDWIAGSYRKSVEAGKLWLPSKTQKAVMALTGARTPRLAGQIVSMPREVGLDIFEFAASPRSSALFMPLPREPSLTPQLVSIPYKEILIETGKATPVISKSLLEAQQATWDLMQTPKTSGVMVWKLTTTETQKHYLHLISRQGYTTIGSFLYEKPFSTGFLYAPTGVVVSTTITRATGKKAPFYPQMMETPRTVTRTIPYAPSLTEPFGKTAPAFALPIVAPSIPKTKVKTVVSPFTTPHLFPDITATTKQRRTAIPSIVAEVITGTKQTQMFAPVLTVPVTDIPKQPDFPTPEPSFPSPPFATTPPSFPSTQKGFPLWPRGGGDAGSRSFGRVFGRWFPRTHKVKTWEQQLKTFGFKAPKSAVKLGKVKGFGDLGKVAKSFSLDLTRKKRGKRRVRRRRKR